jgi:hypothetical protein
VIDIRNQSVGTQGFSNGNSHWGSLDQKWSLKVYERKVLFTGKNWPAGTAEVFFTSFSFGKMLNFS